MVIQVVPLVIAVVGLLMWAMGSNAKVCEAGRILFFCGAFAFTMHAGGKALTF